MELNSDGLTGADMLLDEVANIVMAAFGKRNNNGL
jgi:hypothetical protein